MQTSLDVKVLAGKAQVVGDGVDLDLNLAVGQIGSLPDHGAGGGDQLLRCA